MQSFHHRTLSIVATVALITSLGLGATHAQSEQKKFPRIATMSHADRASTRGSTFILQTELPATPPAVQVFKVQPSASKKQTLLGIFQSLSLTPSPETNERLQALERVPEQLIEQEDELGATIGGWRVKVWNGGQFSIENDKLREHLSNLGKLSPAPTPEAARKAADDFLAMIGPLAAPIHFSEVVKGEELIYGSGDKPGDRVVTKLNVSYFAKMDDIPVFNAVGIQVGAGPAVVYMANRLRQVVPAGKVPIMSPQEAFDLLGQGKGYYEASTVAPAKRSVDSIQLVYWQSPLATDLIYVVPVYMFTGPEKHQGWPDDKWSAFVEAIRPEYLEEQAPKRP
jgi:hypothetical protein